MEAVLALFALLALVVGFTSVFLVVLVVLERMREGRWPSAEQVTTWIVDVLSAATALVPRSKDRSEWPAGRSTRESKPDDQQAT